MTNSPKRELKWKTGVVTLDPKLTFGGAGNQWTTIDGVRYATWWNWDKINPKAGDVVEFSQYQAPLWAGMAPIPCAHIRVPQVAS